MSATREALEAQATAQQQLEDLQQAYRELQQHHGTLQVALTACCSALTVEMGHSEAMTVVALVAVVAVVVWCGIRRVVPLTALSCGCTVRTIAACGDAHLKATFTTPVMQSSVWRLAAVVVCCCCCSCCSGRSSSPAAHYNIMSHIQHFRLLRTWTTARSH
jgi:hypothetical protein